MTINCDFCGAVLDLDNPNAPTTYTNENNDYEWCQACEDRMQAEVDAMTPAELADWMEQDGKRDTRQFERVVDVLRQMPAPAQAEPNEDRPTPAQVPVDADLIRQVIRALMGYGSTLHAQSFTTQNPDVQLAKMDEVRQVRKLEGALRDTLALEPRNYDALKAAYQNAERVALEQWPVDWCWPGDLATGLSRIFSRWEEASTLTPEDVERIMGKVRGLVESAERIELILAEWEGIEAGLKGCVATHNRYALTPDEVSRDAWERGNKRVRDFLARAQAESGKTLCSLQHDGCGGLGLMEHHAQVMGRVQALPELWRAKANRMGGAFGNGLNDAANMLEANISSESAPCSVCGLPDSLGYCGCELAPDEYAARKAKEGGEG